MQSTAYLARNKEIVQAISQKEPIVQTYWESGTYWRASSWRLSNQKTTGYYCSQRLSTLSRLTYYFKDFLSAATPEGLIKRLLVNLELWGSRVPTSSFFDATN